MIYIYCVAGWMGFMPLSFYVRMQNENQITVGDVGLMLFLGPLYFFNQLARWDVVVWKKDKK